MAKGAARRVPASLPEPSGSLLVLRNTTKATRLLATWSRLYAADDAAGKHPTSDQPLLRAALFDAEPAVRWLDRAFGCPAWANAARRCPAFTRATRAATRATVSASGRAKLSGPHAKAWRRHARKIDEAGGCVVVHGVHGGD